MLGGFDPPPEPELPKLPNPEPLLPLPLEPELPKFPKPEPLLPLPLLEPKLESATEPVAPVPAVLLVPVPFTFPPFAMPPPFSSISSCGS